MQILLQPAAVLQAQVWYLAQRHTHSAESSIGTSPERHRRRVPPAFQGKVHQLQNAGMLTRA